MLINVLTKPSPNSSRKNTGKPRDKPQGMIPKWFINSIPFVFPVSTYLSAMCWNTVLENLAKISSCVNNAARAIPIEAAKVTGSAPVTAPRAVVIIPEEVIFGIEAPPYVPAPN